MPRVSKAARIQRKSDGTKPGAAQQEKEKLDKYMCTRCGKVYTKQKGNFPASQSPLFVESGYLPVCNHCMEGLYEHYKEALGSGEAAMQRLCLKFDVYWNPEIWGMVSKISTSTSRVRQYISKTFLIRYIGRSYDDTLDEAAKPFIPLAMSDIEEDENGEAPIKTNVTQETMLFWGAGFDEAMYKELDMRYERWTKDLPKPMPIVVESLYKQICIQEAQITRRAAAGQDVEKGQNALNNLLSSLNVKPNQKKDDESADLETTPLGVWAKRWEDNRPIPDSDDIPEPSLIKFIHVFFFGHIAKCLGLKNMYSQLYEDEMSKYRVAKPEFEDEDDDAVIADMTGGE